MAKQGNNMSVVMTLYQLHINGCGLRCARTASFFTCSREQGRIKKKSGKLKRRPVSVHVSLKR